MKLTKDDLFKMVLLIADSIVQKRDCTGCPVWSGSRCNYIDSQAKCVNRIIDFYADIVDENKKLKNTLYRR